MEILSVLKLLPSVLEREQKTCVEIQLVVWIQVR